MHHATYNCILSSWGLARKLAVVPNYEYDKMGGVSVYTNQFIGIKNPYSNWQDRKGRICAKWVPPNYQVRSFPLNTTGTLHLQIQNVVSMFRLTPALPECRGGANSSL